MSILKRVLQKAKRGIKKNLIEPSQRVNEYNKKMDALNKQKAKEGKFNTGEDYPLSQSM